MNERQEAEQNGGNAKSYPAPRDDMQPFEKQAAGDPALELHVGIGQIDSCQNVLSASQAFTE